MGSPEEYMCTLDAACLKKAREELNEDPADRMNAVEAFRNLIKTRGPHIKCSMGKCVCVCVCVIATHYMFTDAPFFLGFLWIICA